MALNTVSDVRRVLNIDSGNQNLTHTEINFWLDSANTDLFNYIKRNNEVQKFRVSYNFRGDKQTFYTLNLNPIEELLAVVKNGETMAVSDYSYDSQRNAIELDEDKIRVDDEIIVLYTPKIYKEAELYLCAYNIFVTKNLVRQGGETSSVLENIEKKKDEYMKLIKGRISIGQWH